MTTKTLTDTQALTAVKHLASGKDLDAVAAILRADRSTVLDVASKHGYPDMDKLAWAADVLTKNLDSARAATITELAPQPLRPAARAVGADSTPAPTVTARPDGIGDLLNTAKGHPSKRIQSQANRVLDGLGRLRDLFAEDEAKHAVKREAEAQKAAAKAEVARLEKALAAAKVKLRSKGTGTTIAVSGDVSAADLRAWAKRKGIDVPAMGRVPVAVREAYAAENPEQAAS